MSSEYHTLSARSEQTEQKVAAKWNGDQLLGSGDSGAYAPCRLLAICGTTTLNYLQGAEDSAKASLN